MNILLAEDEKDLSRALSAILTHKKYTVTAVYNGRDAVDKALEGTYDCMIFDIMMPIMDGITALKKIREEGINTPVLFLTAKSEMDDKVAGLDAGADDYLTKPFAMVELLARIRSLTRRNADYAPKEFKYGNVVLDKTNQELKSENTVRLAPQEAKLMEFLMVNGGKELDTDEIFANVWKDEQDVDKSVVWLYISYLRNKLKAIDADIEIIGEENTSFTLVTID